MCWFADDIEDINYVIPTDIRLLPSPNSPLKDGLLGNCVPLPSGVTTMTLHINQTIASVTPNPFTYRITVLTQNLPCAFSFHTQVGFDMRGSRCPRFQRCQRDAFAMTSAGRSQCSFTCYCDDCGEQFMIRLAKVEEHQPSNSNNNSSALCWVTLEKINESTDLYATIDMQQQGV